MGYLGYGRSIWFLGEYYGRVLWTVVTSSFWSA